MFSLQKLFTPKLFATILPHSNNISASLSFYFDIFYPNISSLHLFTTITQNMEAQSTHHITSHSIQTRRLMNVITLFFSSTYTLYHHYNTLVGNHRRPLRAIGPLVVVDSVGRARAVGQVRGRRAGGDGVALLWASVGLEYSQYLFFMTRRGCHIGKDLRIRSTRSRSAP
jgi:hypothetical protein